MIFDGATKRGMLFLLSLHPQLSSMRSRIDYLDSLIFAYSVKAERLVRHC